MWGHLSATVVRLGVVSLLVTAGSLAAQTVVPLGRARGENTVVLTDSRQSYPLGLDLEILEDREKAWTIDDVSSPEFARRFARSTEPIPNFGFTESAWWVRFRVRNEATPARRWLLLYDHTYVDRIEFYLPTVEGRGYRVLRTGIRLPFTSRGVPHRRFVFDLPFLHDRPVAERREGTVYLRFSGEMPLILPLEISLQESLLRRDHYSQLGLGIFYGALLILFGYHLFLFFLLRESAHLLLVGSIFFLMVPLANLDGTFLLYLWPKNLPFRPSYVAPLACLSMIFSTLFMRTFLRTNVRAPRLHRVSGVFVLLFALLAVVSPFVRYHASVKLFLVMMIALAVFIVGVGVRIRIKGYRPARLFSLAWLVVLAGEALHALTRFDLVPGASLTEPLIKIGVLGQGFFLSLSLADRINAVRSEKKAAQRQLVDEQQRAIRLKEELNRKLEARNRELETFYYTLSHDIKNPIVTIGGFIGEVERHALAADTVRLNEDKIRIRDAADKLHRLVDQMVDLSHLDRLPNSAAVRLYEIARETIAGMAEPIARRRIEVEISDALPVVEGDRTQLAEVMRILVENAIRHMGDKPRRRLRIGVKKDGSEIVTYVEDNGAGIDRRYHEKIFGLFERLSAEGEGTGIGLARAKRIVEMHGGRIWVESEGKGQGCTFCLTLPGRSVRPR